MSDAGRKRALAGQSMRACCRIGPYGSRDMIWYILPPVNEWDRDFLSRQEAKKARSGFPKGENLPPPGRGI